MATDSSRRVRVTERTWGDVVREAEMLGEPRPLGPPTREPGYEWSNGKRFLTPVDPYA